MEISGKFKERGTVITAVLTLAIIGISLLASTWQNMENQRTAEQQHLYLTSRALLQVLENSLRRGPILLGPDMLTPRTVETFAALERDNDVIFAGIIDQRGGKVLTSGDQLILLPPHILSNLFENGEWFGKILIDQQDVFVSGKLVTIRNKTLTLSESPPAPIFLLVGIDTDHYLTLHVGFRKNIMLQAAYILVAALVCWYLAFSFLSRRNQAKRAEDLELFQDKLLDNLPDGLIIIGTDNTILAANPAARSILQDSDTSFIGKKTVIFPEAISRGITASVASNDTNRQAWQRVSADGLHLEIRALPIHDEDSTFLVLIRDRTALRSLEQSLAEAEKLAVIGTLAAGVAHEVRNPLSALRGFAQYFLKKLSGQHPEEEYARTMVTEADRLNRVITDLLFLARPKRIAPQEVNLASMVSDICVLLRFDFEQKTATIETDLTATMVFADQDALKQSLLNLLLNSLDALVGKRGIVTIASGRENSAVWVEVRDTGCGMTKEQQAQAFEPFFTAKARGTGLGLSLVQQTMHDHGGTATIASEEGHGCAIHLVFPDKDVSPVITGLASLPTTAPLTDTCGIQLPLLEPNGAKE